MAGSIIDMGEVGRMALGFANLEETRRRNDLFERRAKTDEDELGVQRQRMQQQQFTNLMKLADDDRVRSNPELGISILQEASKAAGGPVLSAESIRRGMDQKRAMLDNMQRGNREQAQDALIELQVFSSPEDAKKIVDSVSSVQKMSEYTENVESLRQLQQARFEKLHGGMAKVNAGTLPYSSAAKDFVVALNGVDTPAFTKAMRLTETMKGKEPLVPGRVAKIVNDQDLTQLVGPQMKGIEQYANQSAQQHIQKAQEIKQRLDLIDLGEKLPEGMTRQDLVEQRLVSQDLGQAYATMGEWSQDPFNKSKLKGVRAAKMTIENSLKSLGDLKLKSQEEAVQIRRDAQSFRETEAGQKHTHEKNIAAAQSDVLGKFGYTPSAEAVAAVARQYNVAPSEIMPGLADPAKKGKLDVGIKLGQEDVSRNLKAIDSAQGVVDFTHELRERIEKNPAIVGAGAKIGTALAGSGQQLRAIAGLDPSAAKFLNTKTRDEAESFYEIMVYLQARSMDPSGVLDIKVVENARKVLGDINSFTAGPKQLLNKLGVVQANAERNIRRARRTLKGGVASALTDAPDPEKQLGQMSEQELMQMILQGVNP